MIGSGSGFEKVGCFQGSDPGKTQARSGCFFSDPDPVFEMRSDLDPVFEI